MTLNEQFYDHELESIINKAVQKGFDLKQYRITFLKRRIDTRLRTRGVDTYLQYSNLLDVDPTEYLSLFGSISINVTEFFRNNDVFVIFNSKIVPELLLHKSKFNTLRIWSAGCATGEEPYSLAMILNESIGKTNAQPFKIFATDINAKAIDIAKKGKYHKSSLKHVSPEFLEKYFTKLSDDEYEVSPEIKNSVVFNIGDLTSVQVNHLDAIFCRNVMIYHDKARQKILYKKFHDMLNSQGFLILGMDEGVRGDQLTLFKPVIPYQRIYKKIEI